MNVGLLLRQVVQTIIKTTPDQTGAAWNDERASCMIIDSKLDLFTSWVRDSPDATKRGLWHLLTDCYNSGTVGLAWVGTICNTGTNSGVSGYTGNSFWRIVAHEVGHNFNGGHSFEEGQGVTGGIMDYGNNIMINGVYQFNTKYRKEEMCSHLTSRTTRSDAMVNCFAFEASDVTYEYMGSEWSTCSEPCGPDGMQTRSVFCVNSELPTTSTGAPLKVCQHTFLLLPFVFFFCFFFFFISLGFSLFHFFQSLQPLLFTFLQFLLF